MSLNWTQCHPWPLSHCTVAIIISKQGRVAQLVERSLSMFTSMRKVLGSIPSSSKIPLLNHYENV